MLTLTAWNDNYNFMPNKIYLFILIMLKMILLSINYPYTIILNLIIQLYLHYVDPNCLKWRLKILCPWPQGQGNVIKDRDFQKAFSHIASFHFMNRSLKYFKPFRRYLITKILYVRNYNKTYKKLLYFTYFWKKNGAELYNAIWQAYFSRRCN